MTGVPRRYAGGLFLFAANSQTSGILPCSVPFSRCVINGRLGLHQWRRDAVGLAGLLYSEGDLVAGILPDKLGLQIIHHHVIVEGCLNHVHQLLAVQVDPRLLLLIVLSFLPS